MQHTRPPAFALAICLTAILLTPAALGQSRMQPGGSAQDAGSDEATKGRYPSVYVDGKLYLADDNARRVLISPNNRALVSRTDADHTTEVIDRPNGFDLVVTMTNTADEPVAAGMITIPGIRLAPKLIARNFRVDSKTETFDSRGRQQHRTTGYTYPHNIYSPVAVFGDRRHTIGVSVLYPIMEYEQQMRLQLVTPGRGTWRNGFNWELRIRPLDEHEVSATLEPGRTYTYTVAVRATDNHDRWIATLAPYQDYFHRTYGGMAYTPDCRPVRGVALTQNTAQTRNNPHGFVNPDLAPHIHGWKPWADRIAQTTRPHGYERIMLWSPSGLRRNSTMNFPFRFMTHMLDQPLLADSLSELRALPETGIDIGYWWGRSQRITQSWTSPGYEQLDPENPEHVRLAHAELDMAAGDLGATMIGLDAYHQLPGWEAVRWLESMKERHPHARFIIEPYNADILHRHGALFLNATQVETHKHLADMLLPGHETWVRTQYGPMERRLGRRMTEREMQAEALRIARLGYTPLIFRNVKLDHRNYDARDTTTYTLPPAMRRDPGDHVRDEPNTRPGGDPDLDSGGDSGDDRDGVQAQDGSGGSDHADSGTTDTGPNTRRVSRRELQEQIRAANPNLSRHEIREAIRRAKNPRSNRDR